MIRSAPPIAGVECPNCKGTGWLRYDWGHVQTEKLCPHCIGTGMRGRHRR